MNLNGFERYKTTNLEKNSDSKVFIKIPLETGGFWQKEYYQNDLIENVVNDFKAENHMEIPEDYFMDWNFNNKKLKMTDKIKTLINQEIPTVCLNQVIKRKTLNISNEEIIPELVGKPFNDPFEVFLFTKEDKSLKIQTYDPTTVSNLYLNNYSPSSSYCNGNNHLFISGGENKNGEIIDYFWEIDLKSQNIAEPTKIPPKKNHSMIFIPNNYVFIVGGNDKKTFYFNTENAEVCEWADLNILRNEPALEKLSNYLYCFDNINKGTNDTFTLERTDLNSNSPKWILLAPKFNFINGNNLKLNQKFFGVSKDEEQNIIFLGGNMDDYNKNDEIYNYRYNTNLNTIEESKVPYRRYNFKEKTFLPYKKNIDYILPDFNKQHPEVVFFVKKNNKIEAIDYEPKMNSQLKSLKAPISDFKYDFNMPTVSLPEQITDFNFGQENTQINENETNPNNNNRINVMSSFKDMNFFNQNENDNNGNNKIELQTNFKEPEIEPMKEDLKLSIEVNKDLLKSKEVLKDKNYNINNQPINNVMNSKIQYDRYFNNLSNNNNEVYNIPKFHSCVNEQGNELNITQNKYLKNTNKNHIANNQNIKLNSNVEYKLGIETNSPKIEIKDEKNKNIDSSVSGVISGTGGATNINIKPFNYKAIDFTKDVILKGTIPGTKLNINKANLNPKNNKDYNLVGIIPGKPNKSNNNLTKKNSNINPNVKLEINEPKINTNNINIHMNENISQINGTKMNVEPTNIKIKSQKNINSQNITLDNIIRTNTEINQSIPNYSNIKMPDVNLTGNISGKPINMNNSNIYLKSQTNYKINSDIPDKTLEELKIDVPSQKIEVNAKNNNMIDYDLNGNIQGIKMNNSNINIPSQNINLKSDFILSGIIKGTKQIPKNIQINNNIRKIPDYNINGNIPGIGTNNKKANLNNTKKENVILSGIIKGQKIPKVEVKTKEKNLKANKIEIPNLNLSQNIPQMNLQGNSEINIPNNGLKITKLNEQNIDINLNHPNVDMNLEEPKLQGINNNEELKINLPNIETQAPKINLKGPNININEANLPDNNIKIGMPSINSNINLTNGINTDYNLEEEIKGINMNNSNIKLSQPNVKVNKISIPDYNICGSISGIKMDKPNINKDIDIRGSITGKKPQEIQLQNPKAIINIKNPNTNIQIPNTSVQQQIPQLQMNPANISINGNAGNINLIESKLPQESINVNIPKVELPEENINNINFQNSKMNIPLEYNISGNIPGVKVTKLNKKQSNSDFFLEGIIPSEFANINTKMNYKINNTDINRYNTVQGNINKNFHGNINSPQNLDYYYEIKGLRKVTNTQIPTNTIDLRNQIKLEEKKKYTNSNNVNLVASQIQIFPEENYNINDSQNVMQKSNNDFYPPGINNTNSKTSYNYNLDNINLQKSVDYQIGKKLENNNQQNITNSINNNYMIDSNQIKVEMPKTDLNFNPNNLYNLNDNHKVTGLRFKTIEEDNENLTSGARSGSNRGNSKKRNKELPSVGVKYNSFKTSKVGAVGNLNTENIDINNLKSANVGVNGVKIGDRIIQ